jgi:MFS family permease
MISLARYSTLLARPDFKSVLVASIIGRLPIGLTGLSILLLSQGATGSFVRGGATAAAYVVGLACFAPVLGRIIDRSGPRAVLLWSACAFPASLVALVLAVRADAMARSFRFSSPSRPGALFHRSPCACGPFSDAGLPKNLFSPLRIRSKRS